ncbi:hypothetical protein HY837_01590 [archaeon]|nr:hypothetical protein [archaeon]
MINKLAGGIIASVALASPVYAQESFSELKKSYEEFSREKIQDGILTPEEIKASHDYLEEKLKMLGEKKRTEKDEKTVSSKLENLESLKKFYPGLLDNKANLIYLTDEQLIKEHSEILKKTISENPKQELSYLDSKNNLTIEDLVKAYKTYNVDLDDLRFIRSYMEEQEVQNLLNRKLNILKSYLNSKEKVEHSFWNDKRHVSFGLISWLVASQEYSDFEQKIRLITQDFSETTNKENFTTQTFEEVFPDYVLVDTKRKILGLFLSALLPITLRVLTKKYRRDDFTNNNIGYHAADGIFNVLFGLDGLIHPLAFYARVVGPIVYDICKGVKE